MFLLLYLILLFAPCTAQEINPTFLKYFYMPVAAAAYSDNPDICLQLMNVWWYPGLKPPYFMKVYRQYTIECKSLNSTCSGYIAIYKFEEVIGNGNIIIGFKGVTNFEEFYQHRWNYDEMVPFVGGGKVNKQFFDAFNDIWINAGMKDDVVTLKNKYPRFYIYISGHSVGGAMAALAAATIVSTGIKSAGDVGFGTFGQPRIGDKDFANAFNSSNYHNSLRIVHFHDVVPHLPPLNSTAYYHHMYEIWYPDDMGDGEDYPWVCNFDGEDTRCSDSLNFTSLNFDDHKVYYGRYFIDYGIQGCPDLVLDEK